MRTLSLGLTLALASPALAQYTTAAVTNGGTLTGKVSYVGARPTLPPEKRDRNPEICGSTGPDQSLLVDKSGGLKDVIVYLKDIPSGKPLNPGTADLDQKGCTYVPHVLAVPAGTTLNILNSDPLLHNIHASTAGTTVFNYAMPMSVKRIPRKVTKPGMIDLKCDVHGWMNGLLGVMANPYFAVTAEDGTFTIADVPPGTYTIEAYQERLHNKAQQVVVAPGGSTAVNFSYSGP